MTQDLGITFSAISLMIWVMLWLLGIVRSMLPIQYTESERSRFIVPAMLYGVAVLIGFTVIMFVGFTLVPNQTSRLLANIGMALLVVQAVIIFVAPYIVSITAKGYRKVSNRSLIVAHIMGTVWVIWAGMFMRFAVNLITGTGNRFDVQSLLTTLAVSIFMVFLAYAEFMWITGRRLNGSSKESANTVESSSEAAGNNPPA